MGLTRLKGLVYDANCYIISLDKEVVIIDPCADASEIMEVAENKPISYIILTHAHADHFNSLEELLKISDAKVIMHPSAKEKLNNKFYNVSDDYDKPIEIEIDDDRIILVDDGFMLEVEGKAFTFLHTPGHSSCSMCIKVDNYLFSGDTLFYNGIGRYDLYSSSFVELRKSLRKLSSLDPSLMLLPGHGPRSMLGLEVTRYIPKN